MYIILTWNKSNMFVQLLWRLRKAFSTIYICQKWQLNRSVDTELDIQTCVNLGRYWFVLQACLYSLYLSKHLASRTNTSINICQYSPVDWGKMEQESTLAIFNRKIEDIANHEHQLHNHSNRRERGGFGGILYAGFNIFCMKILFFINVLFMQTAIKYIYVVWYRYD